MQHGDYSRGATLLKLKSEMLRYHQILKRFLVLFGCILHIKSKSVKRAFQRHIIRAISTSNEGDMSVAKSVRSIGGRPPKVAFGQIRSRSVAQTWRTTTRFGLTSSFGPISDFQLIFQWVSNQLGFISFICIFLILNQVVNISLFKGQLSSIKLFREIILIRNTYCVSEVLPLSLGSS